MKYVYPAVFTLVESEGYGVEFPDLKGCAEEGDDLYAALSLAQEALSDWLMFLEDTGQKIPQASGLSELKLEENQFANLIFADTDEWRKQNARRAS